MKPVFLPLVLGTMVVLNLSASKIDNDEGVVKQDQKKQFTFPCWKSLHKLNAEALESDSHQAWFDICLLYTSPSPRDS